MVSYDIKIKKLINYKGVKIDQNITFWNIKIKLFFVNFDPFIMDLFSLILEENILDKLDNQCQ